MDSNFLGEADWAVPWGLVWLARAVKGVSDRLDLLGLGKSVSPSDHGHGPVSWTAVPW